MTGCFTMTLSREIIVIVQHSEVKSSLSWEYYTQYGLEMASHSVVTLRRDTLHGNSWCLPGQSSSKTIVILRGLSWDARPFSGYTWRRQHILWGSQGPIALSQYIFTLEMVLKCQIICWWHCWREIVSSLLIHIMVSKFMSLCTTWQGEVPVLQQAPLWMD